MTINSILVIEPNEDWQGKYRTHLPSKFPGADIEIISDNDVDVASLSGNYGLCITVYKTTTPANIPGHLVFLQLDDNLRERTTALRQANPNIKIAVITGHSGLEHIAESLGIAYFPKTTRDLFERIAEYCADK